MEKMSIGTELVEIILQKGWSKYKIAKTLGVTWQTVNNWHRGRFQPSQTYAVKLKEMGQVD